MRCPRHSKEFVYTCNWCGKELCERCEKKKYSDLKVYCMDCAAKLKKSEKAKAVVSPKVEIKKEQKIEMY
ncbi:MAG: hypothetical protein QW331_04830 [Candidatus Woesearchaeota archaeon]